MSEHQFGKRPVRYPRTASVRVTDEEKLRLKAEAQTAGLSVSDLLRERCLPPESGKPPGRQPTRPNCPDQKRLIWEINRIGVNLNQLARAINTAARYGQPIDVLAVLATLRSMEAELEALLHTH